MIQPETFFELAMPIGEPLTLSKIEFAPIYPMEPAKGGAAKLLSHRAGGKTPSFTVSIVSGIQEDELDDLYITYLLKQFLNPNRGKLRGKVKLI